MANTVFENKVIEAKVTDLLTTSINARNYMTLDNSLTGTAGMTKTINVYTYTGEAEELETGEGNSTYGSIAYVGTDYKVKRAQHAGKYFDDDFMKDNTIVDGIAKGGAQILVNKMTADFVNECKKATLSVPGALSYDTIVDAISELNLENEANVFVIIPNEQKALLRKDADYVAARQGEVVYTGQVGTICGIPVIASKAFTEPYVMTKEAVKLFMKKDVEIEQDRDIETKENKIVFSTYYICALADATKICKIATA